MRIGNITPYGYSPVRFRGNSQQEHSILEKYGINPDEVGVIASSKDIYPGCKEKQALIKKILEAHDLAVKNNTYGNITNRGFATNLCLEDGTWHLGTNFSNTRSELSCICGERAALIDAYNETLKKQPEISLAKKDLNFKVKIMAMSSNKPLGEDHDAACPCAECLSWFDAPRYFSDDTVIATLQNDKNGRLNLVLSKLTDYLPQRPEMVVSPKGPTSKLPVIMSDKAKIVAYDKDISLDKIKDQVSRTVDKYDDNKFAEISGQNITASVAANRGYYFGSKVDFTKRWYIEPLEYAVGKAIEDNGEGTHIDTVCYVGDEIKAPNSPLSSDRVINIKTLGEIMPKFADKDTLVISTRNDAIDVKTIGEYMPDEFRFKQDYDVK